MTFKPVSQNFKDLIHHLQTVDNDNAPDVKCLHMLQDDHSCWSVFQGKQVSGTAQ